jgi:hypothetical protein
VEEPSQLDVDEECRLKWGLSTIARWPRPRSPDAERGEMLHAQLESYLGGGPLPSDDALVKALQKDVPELFSSSATPATGSGGGNPATGAPSVSRLDIEKMTPAQYREYKANFLAGKIKL